MQIYRFENPEFLNEYVSYLSVVKGLSKNTVMVYYQDIRQFLRFIILWKDKTAEITAQSLKNVKIQDFTIEQLKTVTLRDIHNYYNFIANECHNQDKIRTRKASSLRSFFKYLTKQADLLDYDPTTNLELSSPKRALPKYLNLSESVNLLRTTANSDHKVKPEGLLHSDLIFELWVTFRGTDWIEFILAGYGRNANESSRQGFKRTDCLLEFRLYVGIGRISARTSGNRHQRNCPVSLQSGKAHQQAQSSADCGRIPSGSWFKRSGTLHT